jgi:hypothetical protein
VSLAPGLGHRGSPPPAVQPAQPAARPATPGAAGVAAAYRYPLNCLTVTFAPGDPAYARARLDRASPCWRIGAYDTTILHRVGGIWRVVLNAPSYVCPVASLPPAVQVTLALCPAGPRVARVGRYRDRTRQGREDG